VSNTLVVYDASNTLVVSAPGPQGPAGSGGGGSISDGDKGDITVSNSGATWSVDAGAISTAKIADDAVTFAKLQNITGPSLIGRSGSAGTGSPELIGLAAALTINGSKQLDLAAAVVAAATTVTAGTGLTGGGDLSANRTFTLDFATSGASSTTKAVRADDSRLSDSRTPSAHTHGLTDSYVGEIAAAANQTYTIDRYVAVGRTITDIRIQSTAGTCFATVKNGANTVSTVSVSSTSGGSAPLMSNTTVSQNGAITLEISSNSSAVNVSFALRYTAATGAIS
jgi:hypothetical protein